MAKIALCAYCNTAVLLKPIDTTALEPEPIHANDLAKWDEIISSRSQKRKRHNDEVMAESLCRCGKTQAYYNELGHAFVTQTCVVFGCDTTEITLAINPNTQVKRVSWYRIDVPSKNTSLIPSAQAQSQPKSSEPRKGRR